MNAVFTPDQDRRAIARIAIGNSGANNGFFFAFGKGDPFGMCAHIIGNQLKMCCRRIKTPAQLIFIFRHINDRTTRHTTVHRRLCHRLGDRNDQARVKRGWNDVFRAILQTPPGIGRGHLIRHIFTRQGCHRMGRGNFHVLVDGGCLHIKCTTENIREAQHVVDLVGIIRPPGGTDRVIADRCNFFRADFRVRVGHGKNDRLFRHAFDHLGRHRPLGRQTKERIRPIHRIFKRAGIGVGCVG